MGDLFSRTKNAIAVTFGLAWIIFLILGLGYIIIVEGTGGRGGNPQKSYMEDWYE